MYSPPILLIATVFYTAFLLAARKWLDKGTEKQLKIISATLTISFFGGLLFVGLSTRIIPKVDLCHAYIEAINMLDTGVMTDKWQFERFPHQKAVAFMLYFLYRAAGIFGLANYRSLGIVFNAVMVTLALFFLYKLVCDYKGRPTAILAVMIFACNPIIYFYVSYFYSDTLCLPFMMGGLWLAGRGLREPQSAKRMCFLVASAIILVLGAEVRATVIFALFAVLLVSISTEHRKPAILACFALIVGLLVGKMIYHQINSTYAGDIAQDVGYPITHYVMMGSNEKTTGAWTYADDSFTASLATHQEKVKGNVGVIMDRVRSMGPGGCLKLISKKIALVWGDGRMGYHASNAQMEQYNFLYEYSMGDKAIFLRGIMQFMRCSLYLLILAALAAFIRRGDQAFSDKVSAVVCLAGFAFYVFWEVQPRYSLMYLTTMSILAGSGVEALYSARKIQSVSIITKDGVNTEGKEIVLNRSAFSKTICGLLCCAMLFTAYFWGIEYHDYAGNIQERSEMRVNQEVVEGTQTIDREGILQSFVPEDAFNCVSIKFRNSKMRGQKYYFQILDKNQKVLAEQNFSSDSVTDDRYKSFCFDTIYPGRDDVYYIKVFATEDYDTSIEISSAYRKHSEAYASGYDFYPGGDLIRSEVPEHTDMTFRVTNIKMRSIVSRRVYILLTFGSLLFEGTVILMLYKTPRKRYDF